MEPIGRIMEVFGQVEHPFYLVRWPKDMSNPNLAVNDVVYMNMTNAHFILPAQLNSVGTDASNVFDEEPNEKERVFIECTEDVVNNEIRSCRSAESPLEDESESATLSVNYQQEFVIPPSVKRDAPPVNRMVTPFQNPFLASMIPPTPQPQTQNDMSGMDILRNSYF